MPYNIDYYRFCGYITEDNTVTDVQLDTETIINVLNKSINRRIYVHGHGKYRIKSLIIDSSRIEQSYVVVGSYSTINVRLKDIIDADRLNRSHLESGQGNCPRTKDFNTNNGYYGSRIAEMIRHRLKANPEPSRP